MKRTVFIASVMFSTLNLCATTMLEALDISSYDTYAFCSLVHDSAWKVKSSTYELLSGSGYAVGNGAVGGYYAYCNGAEGSDQNGIILTVPAQEP